MIEPSRKFVLPVVPLRETVLFPGIVLPLLVGREESVAAVEAALSTEDKALAVFSLRDSSVEKPTKEHLYPVGTRAVIRKMSRRKKPQLEVVCQGAERIRLLEITQSGPFIQVAAVPYPLGAAPHSEEVEALHRAILDAAEKMQVLAQPETAIKLRDLLTQIKEPISQIYLLASMMNLELEKEQTLLEAPTEIEAFRLMHEYLLHEVHVLELRQQIAKSAAEEMGKQQREFVLRQQIEAIQKELGEGGESEVTLLKEKLEKADLPESVSKEATREVNRLSRLSSSSPDYQVTRSYIEFIIELPWKKGTKDDLDLSHARRVLDCDHFDLKDIKERIVEHLAVLKMNPQAKSPILCFVGPPGVGKTSLGESIARALGRKFERMSLGGLHDEAELRGHRRTYIGAMPGRVLQSIRRVGVNNPVLMLDEVDKLGRDFRGDPAAALMEILDPAQNVEFRDNYLDLPFDLSKVFFIATANSLDTIPSPLLDRMEILRLSGYTLEEKLQIAERYLLPRQIEQVGLAPKQIQIPPETLSAIINDYTKEAGVRDLERNIGKITRKVVTAIAEGKAAHQTILVGDLQTYLGSKRFYLERARKQLPPGVATGLAWTEAGGEVLYVEAVFVPGETGLTLTGQLGEVMKESAQAARNLIRSNRAQVEKGIHIHVPAGAIPKDGPSAGVTMAAALASLYSQIPLRSDTGMTGEITLTGLVLPVGGIKEKVLAARRAGLRRVILPKENEKDLVDLPTDLKNTVEFIPVDRVEEAIEEASLPSANERLVG